MPKAPRSRSPAPGRTRSTPWRRELGERAHVCPADLRDSAAPDALMADGRGRRSARCHPGQQCRLDAGHAGVAHDAMRTGRAVLDVDLAAPFRLVRAAHARHAAPPGRPDHQYRQHRRRHWQCRPGQLFRRQGWTDRHDQVARAGNRSPWRHGQCRRARLHRNAR